MNIRKPALSEFVQAPGGARYEHADLPAVESAPDRQASEQQALEILSAASDRSITSDELRRETRSPFAEFAFSPRRNNLFRHLKFEPGRTVLEIGAGCGAVSRQLGEAGLIVTALENSDSESRIAAMRCQDLPQVRIVAADFSRVAVDAPFEYVIASGALESSRRFYEATEPMRELLASARAALTPDGVLVLALENPLGITSLLQGAMTTRTNDGSTGYGRRELESLLRDSGFTECEFHYPFPNHFLPQLILTEAGDSHCGFDAGELIRGIGASAGSMQQRIAGSEERLVSSLVARNGLAGQLANSFVVLASTSRAAINALSDQTVLAVSFQTDRAVPYWAKTVLTAAGGEVLMRRERIAESVIEPEERVLTQSLEARQYRRGMNVLAEFERAVELRDFEMVSALLGDLIGFLEQHALREPAGGDPVRAPLKHEWIDAIPSHLLLTHEGMSFFDGEWIAIPGLTFGHLLIRVIDQIAAIDPALPDISRASLFEALGQAGYVLDGHVQREYEAIELAMTRQIHEAPARRREQLKQSLKIDVLLENETRIHEIPESLPVQPVMTQRQALISILKHADELARKGAYRDALRYVADNAPANAVWPGLHLRAAEWNLAIGEIEAAIESALRELTVKPDSERALAIIMQDNETLSRILAAGPTSTMRLVEKIVLSVMGRGE